MERREPECGAAAVIAFEWLQRPENVISGHVKWIGYRTRPGPTIQIVHHKTGVTIDHPLKDTLTNGTLVKFYADAEDIRSQLARWGTPMILREIRTGKSDAEKIAANMQKVPEPQG